MSKTKLYALQGYFLIEFILSLGLSLLLILFLIEIYLLAQKNFRIQFALASIQNKAQTIINLLQADIKLAGYIGCAQLTSDFPLFSPFNYSLTPTNKIFGTDDSITVAHASIRNVNLENILENNLTMLTTQEFNFSLNDKLIISDCNKAEIIQAKLISRTKLGKKIILTYPIHYAFNKNAEVSRLLVNKYFVERKIMANGKEAYFLIKEDINQHKIKLIEGIQKIKFKYATRLNQQYVELTAHEVSDWSKVIGVAIALEISADFITKQWFYYVALKN